MTSDRTTETCCDEFARTDRARLNRRSFLRTATVLGGAAAVSTVHGTAFTSTSYAAAPVERVLVVLSMRGACDGLSLVVPHQDPVYYAARPSIAVPYTRLLEPDDHFGLHPALAPLVPWWTAGKMAAVHATGLPAPNRSHFSAMEEVEDADPGSDKRVGWLNRLIGRNGTGSPVEAIQFGDGVPSAAVSGPQPVLVTASADSVQLSAADDADSATKRYRSMSRMWGEVPGLSLIHI